MKKLNLAFLVLVGLFGFNLSVSATTTENSIINTENFDTNILDKTVSTDSFEIYDENGVLQNNEYFQIIEKIPTNQTKSNIKRKYITVKRMYYSLFYGKK